MGVRLREDTMASLGCCGYSCASSLSTVVSSAAGIRMNRGGASMGLAARVRLQPYRRVSPRRWSSLRAPHPETPGCRDRHGDSLVVGQLRIGDQRFHQVAGKPLPRAARHLSRQVAKGAHVIVDQRRERDGEGAGVAVNLVARQFLVGNATVLHFAALVHLSEPRPVGNLQDVTRAKVGHRRPFEKSA